MKQSGHENQVEYQDHCIHDSDRSNHTAQHAQLKLIQACQPEQAKQAENQKLWSGKCLQGREPGAKRCKGGHLYLAHHLYPGRRPHIVVDLSGTITLAIIFRVFAEPIAIIVNPILHMRVHLKRQSTRI